MIDTQKECYELVSKINTTFDIRIDSGDKSTSVIYFRYYIIDKYKNEPIKVCSVPLNKHFSSISVARKELQTNSFKQEFRDICKVVETMDVKLYQEFVKNYVRKRYDRLYDAGKEIPTKNVKLPKEEAKRLLCKNMKSPLWNIEMHKWTADQWRELKTY